MIVLGSNSEVAQAFVEKCLQEGKKFPKIYLLTSNLETTEKFAKHLEVKYFQNSEVINVDLLQPLDETVLNNIDSDLLFCAAGYLGLNSDEGLFDKENTRKIIDINFAKLVPVIQFFAEKMERKRSGTIIAISSVAGERGRQSNFIYGASKAAFTTYLSGLRNYLYPKKVHVITIKPGFMATKMTDGLQLNPKLTATPKQAAEAIFKAYKKQKNEVYVLPIWWLIMLIIRNIPEFIFKKMKL